MKVNPDVTGVDYHDVAIICDCGVLIIHPKHVPLVECQFCGREEDWDGNERVTNENTQPSGN